VLQQDEDVSEQLDDCVGACQVGAASLAAVESPLSAHTIPTDLWQTAPHKDQLSSTMAGFRDTWRTKNPSIRMHLHDDADIDRSMREISDELAKEDPESFDGVPTLYETFSRMPIPVMKADAWRYAILWQKGGIYADVDVSSDGNVTEYLRKHAACKALIGLEVREDWCQWVMAGVRRHPVFSRTLQLMRLRAIPGFNTTGPVEDAVFFYTGPAMWSAAIEDVLQGRIDQRVPQPTDPSADPHVRLRSHCKIGCDYKGPVAVNARHMYESVREANSPLATRARAEGMCLYDVYLSKVLAPNHYASQMQSEQRGTMGAWIKEANEARENSDEMAEETEAEEEISEHPKNQQFSSLMRHG